MAQQQATEVPQGSGKMPAVLTFLNRKVIPHTPPFAVWLAEWPVAALAHLQWGGSPTASAVLSLISGGLTWHTWYVGRDAKKQRQAQATVTVGAATGWFTAATIAGATDPTLVNAWLMGGPALALAWSIKMTMRTNPDRQQSGDETEKTLWSKIGLGRAKAKEIRAEPNKVVIPMQLDAGVQTQEDAAKAGSRLASAVGVRPNAVRWQPDPEDASQGTYTLVIDDMLKEPTPWPGPSCPGGSIADAPVPAGVYEDYGTADIWFPGDETDGRNAAHYQFMGMTGAGKSQGGRVILVDLMTRRDVCLWLFDPSKGAQTFGPILPGADWALLTMKECKAGIAVLPDVITARANELGKHGYDQWTPEAGEKLGMPYLVCWFEEVAKLFRDGVDLAPVAQEARSAGISLVFSLQRSSHTSMDTDVRGNITGAAVFGTNSSVDSGFALSDDTIDAGARPELWRNRKAGYCYIEGPGIDEQRYATPVRTYLLDKEVAAKAVAAYRNVRPADAGQVTAEAAGPAYAHRVRYAGAEDAAAAQSAAAGDDSDPDLDPEDDALWGDGEEAAVARRIDIDQELPPHTGRDWHFGEQQRDTKTREQALAALNEVLAEFAARGQMEFGPKEVTPELPRIGKTSSWVRRELPKLVAQGVLADTDEAGVYRIIKTLAGAGTGP
ncbi:hypothetical protein [Streptomyces rimosus]|uniref:hypothetical protein n=1 Tax=Streptomyces rimosus TaxID=1927 RepID=UPI00131DFF7A|nr:hypothetical protein [Streptomyces rimosus]